MNHRKLCSGLKPSECKSLIHAWHEAARIGHPLNMLVSIRPTEELTPIERAKFVEKFWDKLGGWRRYHSEEFFCVLTREATFNARQHGLRKHFHALVHIANGKGKAFQAAVARWFPEGLEADVKPAHQGESWSSNGKLRSAIGYVTKQRTQQATYQTRYTRQRGGQVLGKRCKISQNLQAKRVHFSSSGLTQPSGHYSL
jgi:hypothetical protein